MSVQFASIEAEQQLLGCIMVQNDVHALVGDFLHAEHFAEPLHGRLYAEMSARIAKGHLVDPVTLKHSFESDEAMKALGGVGYLARMAGTAVAPRAARDYGVEIVAAYARRCLNTASQDAQADLQGGVDASEVKLRLLRALQSLPETGGEQSSYSMARAMTEAAEQAVKAYQGDFTFLKTGLGPVDKIIRGLAPGDYCLIGGATSMGKTSLALEIAKNVATREGCGVVFVSLEMTRQELATRLAAQKANIAYSELRDAAAMQENDFRRWIEASAVVGQANMRIVPRHVRDVPAIYSAAKRAALDLPGGVPSLVVVDYAQLVRGTGKTRTEQMVDVSISLKHLAGTLDCPVMPLVQLSRALGERDDRRPQLYDIKETGQFENDADQVLMCHREGYWLERYGPKPDHKGQISPEARAIWAGEVERHKNKMEVIVRKNRHGRLATAEMNFHAPTMRFWEVEQEAGW